MHQYMLFVKAKLDNIIRNSVGAWWEIHDEKTAYILRYCPFCGARL